MIAERVTVKKGEKSKIRRVINFTVWVEGTYEQDNNGLYMARYNLPLPRNIGIIEDDNNRYILFAKTSDFINYRLIKHRKNKVALISPPIIERTTKSGRYGLTNINTIFTRMGRIYINENIQNKESHLECICEKAFKALRSKNF